jgi:hypothetical protein
MDGWFKKVQRGHWKRPLGSEEETGNASKGFDSLLPAARPPESSEGAEFPLLPSGCPEGDHRRGSEGGCLLVALDMAAFSTRDNAGLIPQARQGGKGVWAFAAVGSKLDGTGFGKLHMLQTQVAAVAGAVAAGGARKDEVVFGRGVPVALLEGLEVEAAAAARDWSEARLGGLGMSVTLADDLRKPA